MNSGKPKTRPCRGCGAPVSRYSFWCAPCSTRVNLARQRERTAERRAKIEAELEDAGFVRASDVAAEAGVTRNTVNSWANANLRRGSQYRVVLNRSWLHHASAARYLAQRAERLPGKALAGRPCRSEWVMQKQVVAELGCDLSTYRDFLRAHPDIRTATHGRANYVHAEDARVLLARWRSEMALPGWVSLVDLARELDRNLTTLHLIAGRLGLSTRLYRGSGVYASQPSRHVDPNGAAALREWSRSAARKRYAPRRTGGEQRAA